MIMADPKVPLVERIYYVSDGAGSQYKNFKNFANLMHHKEDFDIESQWIFAATAHGKGMCDGMSAVVKCTTKRESLKPDVVIMDSMQMFNFLIRKFEGSDTIQFHHVSSAEVQAEIPRLNERYAKCAKLSGIRKHHIFEPRENNILRMTRAAGTTLFTDVDFIRGEQLPFDLDTMQLGSFYAFVEGSSYYVGMMVGNDDEEGDVEIQTFQINRRTGICSWPDPLVFLNIPFRDILLKLRDPEVVDGAYGVGKEQLKQIREAFKIYKKN